MTGDLPGSGPQRPNQQYNQPEQTATQENKDHSIRLSRRNLFRGFGLAASIATASSLLAACGSSEHANPTNTVHSSPETASPSVSATSAVSSPETATPVNPEEAQIEADSQITGEEFQELPRDRKLRVGDTYLDKLSNTKWSPFDKTTRTLIKRNGGKFADGTFLLDYNPFDKPIDKSASIDDIFRQMTYIEGATLSQTDENGVLNTKIAPQLVAQEYYYTEKDKRISTADYAIDSATDQRVVTTTELTDYTVKEASELTTLTDKEGNVLPARSADIVFGNESDGVYGFTWVLHSHEFNGTTQNRWLVYDVKLAHHNPRCSGGVMVAGVSVTG